MAAAVAEFVSVTEGSDCCPSPVAFRFAVGKNTSSFWHKAAARSRSLYFCWELPGIFDRRTRASIEYELKLQCKSIINFHFIITRTRLELNKNQDHIIKCGKDQDWIGLAAQESPNRLIEWPGPLPYFHIIGPFPPEGGFVRTPRTPPGYGPEYVLVTV